jgi:hypothetical protein
MVTYIIGRKPDPTSSRIVLDDESVSRTHAKLLASGTNRYLLEDLQSSNGTYVRDNGGWRRIQTAHVSAADEIRLGTFVMTVDELIARAVNPKQARDWLGVRVNIFALGIAIALTVLGVKLTSFLPDRIYFSFSKAINTSSRPSPFLITPPYLTETELCKALKDNPELKLLKCDDEQTPSPPVPTTETQQQRQAEINKELGLADSFIKAQTQQMTLSGILSVLVRLVIPCAVGFLVVRLFGADEILAGALGSAAGAFLLCWPIIILWDYVVSDDWRGLYTQFLALYTLYIVMFFYMGRLGGMISTAVRTPNLAIDYRKIIESVSITAISLVVTKFLDSALSAPKP